MAVHLAYALPLVYFLMASSSTAVTTMIRAAVVLAALVALALSDYPKEHYKPVPIADTGRHAEYPAKGNPIVPTPGKYNTTSGPVPNLLNVHVVSHTHVRRTLI